MHCYTEKMQRKGDSLKSPEGDSPQNQQKNGSSGFIEIEVKVKTKAIFTIISPKKQKESRVRLCTEWLTKPKKLG